jgi:two-component sensor histidine kinase
MEVWDAVIADWSLPELSAMLALAIVKALSPDVPFIVVSGTISEDTAVDAMRAGASDYVLKDRLGRLAPAVDRGLREARESVAQRELMTRNAELDERMRERTAELSATLREREVLLQEVHHRVKNNLQVISSLISMQMRRLGDSASRNALEECRSRVRVMALIHEKLYQSKDYARVPFGEYARRLAIEVLRSTGGSPANIALDMAFEDIPLVVDKAIPCGLILNELISNAQKHGFPDDRKGTIRLTLGQVGDQIRLAVWHDGAGIPEGMDVRTSPSLGMQLVFKLADQLNGSVEVVTTGGTLFALTFSTDSARPATLPPHAA